MSTKMKAMEEDAHLFHFGTQVEVTTDEDGFKNSWYKCKIIPPPNPNKSPSSKTYLKRKKDFHWVEYDSIVEEDDTSKPLVEFVHASFIRPLPPPRTTCNQNKFERFDIVEASHRDGWWIGVVLNVMNDGLKYLVGFVTPYEELEFGRNELRLHLNWFGGDKWVRPPKKTPVRSPEDGNETIVASLLESVSARASAMENTPSPAKRLKQATSVDAKRGKCSGSGNAVQDSESPQLLKYWRLSSSEGNIKRSLKLSDRHSNGSMAPSPNIENNKQIDDKSSKTKKRVGAPKVALRRFLNSLQKGEEPGESTTTHEHTPTSDPTGKKSGNSGFVLDSVLQQSPTSDKAGEVLGESSAMQVAAIEHNSTSDHAGKEPEKSGTIQDSAIAIDQSPTGEECGESDTMHDSVIETSPTSDHDDQSQSLPFTKTSKIWKVIESMEVFKKFPQKPHFSPLNEHEEITREMLAICMMSKFAYETERITAISNDAQTIQAIHASLDNFKEMESHGFSTIRFQVYLNGLLEKIEAEKKLQENLAEVDSKIKDFQVEKSAAERNLCDLVAQMKSLEELMKSQNSVKVLKEQQLRELESTRGMISEELISVSKKTPVFEWNAKSIKE